MKVKMKEQQQKIVENMRRWQKIEGASVVSTARIFEKTDNPIVRLVMEIVQRDSQLHHRVQELVVDTLEKKPTTLTPDDVATVWSLVQKHIELEKETVELAKASLEAVGDSKMMVVQKYLLEYLLLDEEKHNRILANLESIKKGMYPYG